jgi:16S rRNA (guanine966-N2)-methyltransferase
VVRISGGKLKGRNIAGLKKIFNLPDSDELRPTSSKVRESIFNILRAEIAGASFLDLYAGTGAVGIEALSRGAARVVFVEKDVVRAGTIMDLVGRLGQEDNAMVFRDTAEAFLLRASKTLTNFDILFIDPPYASEEIGKVIPLVAESGVLKEGGSMLVEHSSRKVMPGRIDGIQKVKTYKYGDTTLTLYRKGQ